MRVGCEVARRSGIMRAVAPWTWICLGLLSASACDADPPGSVLAIRDVTVVDVVEGTLLPDRTILIRDDRIAALGPADEVDVPEGADTFDAEDRYAIPGLWDMHSHTWGPDATRRIVLPLDVANGVVGIRNMAGDCRGDDVACTDRATLEEITAMRRKIEGGELLGPEIHNASTFLDGPHSIKDESLVLRTPEEAREVVREHARAGVDLLKVYDYLPRDVYFALAEEARRQAMPFAGHVPWSVTVAEAARAGQKSMEHGYGLYEATSGIEEQLRHERREALEAEEFTHPDRYDLLFATPDGQFRRMIIRDERRFRFSEARFQELVGVLRENDTWLVPTLAMNATLIDTFDRDLLEYIPHSKRERWVDLIATSQDMDPAERAFRELSLATLDRLIGRMHEAGVGILAGTDCDVDLIVPGFHLHEELARLVDAGLTPLEALRSATLNPAEYLGRTEDMGSTAEGKVADLVVLDANPLEDIRNTRRIRAVVLDGRLLRRSDLDGILEDVREAAR